MAGPFGFRFACALSLCAASGITGSGCAPPAMRVIAEQESGIDAGAFEVGRSYRLTYEDAGDTLQVLGQVSRKDDRSLTLAVWREEDVEVAYRRLLQAERPRGGYVWGSGGLSRFSVFDKSAHEVDLSLRYGRQSNAGFEISAGFLLTGHRPKYAGVRQYGFIFLPQLYVYGEADYLWLGREKGVHAKLGSGIAYSINERFILRPEVDWGVLVTSSGGGYTLGLALRLERVLRE